MEDTKAKELFLQYKDAVPSNSYGVLKQALKNANDTSYEEISIVKTHNLVVIILLSLFLGSLGVDRFVIGDIGLGIAKLLLGWVTFGIWPIIDIFFCYKKAKQKNLEKILAVC